MRSLTRMLILPAAALGLSSPAWSYDLAGKWDLRIEDESHHLVTDLVVEFTSQHAQSCLAGNWMRVAVVSATTNDRHFFPISDPLSFEIDGDRLTIGRNEVCDAYLMLTGTLGGDVVTGTYYGFGLRGSTPLGLFTLSRKGPE